MKNFNYKWNLADLDKIRGANPHNLKVFSTFSCGGGSTMGYKLAGYDVIGANDLDPKMAEVYQHNHKPSYYYLGSVSDLITKEDIPKELFNLDILDGSPPCKTFSMAGAREKKWKESHQYNERMKSEVISDLFFEFIKLAGRLKPKVVISENVKGIVMGNAKVYASTIMKEFDKIGYDVQLFIINAAKVGVPQARERAFFICRRKDLSLPKLDITKLPEFNQKEIPFGEVEKVAKDPYGSPITSKEVIELWENTKAGSSLSTAHPKGHYFGSQKVSKDKVIGTIVASKGSALYHYQKPARLSDEALALCGSFPLDYQYPCLDTQTLVGRSVAPLVMARLSDEVYKQLLSKVK